jgi:hypothetical protein
MEEGGEMMVTDFECLEGAVECSTLTSEQAVGCLRYAGIRISVPIFRDGIVQGVFPFAFVIEAKERNFIISKRKLEAWLEEFTGVKINADEILREVENL